VTPISQPAPSLSLKDHITLVIKLGMESSQSEKSAGGTGAQEPALPSVPHGPSSSSRGAMLRAQMAEGRQEQLCSN
jgi:hypothetical protein